jgi:tRNA U34 2-thiouridine synthase MnmA/TrmU
MVGKAHEWMLANDFDFIITGEVIGQRPMSQRRDTMPVIQRESGAGNLLVRPLCGANLPATRPETEGWIRRENLLGFNGRSRKPQMALAARFGFTDYAQPAGGCCFLTDQAYSSKLADLWTSRGKRDYEVDDIMLLKVGRHLRPRPHFKVIISREEGETNFLQGYSKQFVSIKTTSHAGPLALLDGEVNEQDVFLAARLIARFSKGRGDSEVILEAKYRDGRIQTLHVAPLKTEEIPVEWYV